MVERNWFHLCTIEVGPGFTQCFQGATDYYAHVVAVFLASQQGVTIFQRVCMTQRNAEHY